MRPDEFFIDVSTAGYGGVAKAFDRDRVNKLRRGDDAVNSSVELASALARLLHEDLLDPYENYRLDTADVREALMTLRALVGRLGLPAEAAPFRHRGTLDRLAWDERERLVDSYFEPLIEQLDDLEYELFANVLVNPISPHSETGWPTVDERIRHLRERFAGARQPQHYPSVGLACISVLEALSDAAFDPVRHRDPEHELPSRAKTKIRLELVARYELNDAPRAETIKELVAHAWDLANAVKHSATSNRRDAGIASDATILLVNVIRRTTDSPD